MESHIKDQLALLERDKGIRILFACESGSRAWGFPSQDSDYDVRFFYCHAASWYLQLQKQPDQLTIIQGELDLVGWDLRKMLNLYRASNAVVYELLQSPIVYREQTGFREQVWALAGDYFNPVAGLYHYTAQAHKFVTEYMQADEVKLKACLYVVRATLAARWIQQYGTVPPMELAPLRQVLPDTAIAGWLDDMLTQKKQATEALYVPLYEPLRDYLKQTLSELDAYAKTMRSNIKLPVEPLNQIVTTWIS